MGVIKPRTVRGRECPAEPNAETEALIHERDTRARMRENWLEDGRRGCEPRGRQPPEAGKGQETDLNPTALPTPGFSPVRFILDSLPQEL